MAQVIQHDIALRERREVDGSVPDAPTVHLCYQPFTAEDEFRLLDLHPGNENDLVRCTLSHVFLSDAPEFEAMSYAWGDASDTLAIECDGLSFMVTRNLHALLSNIRYEDRTRTIWVDAVCIDQTNLAERSSQVQIMDRIYSTASSVLAWLGEAADGSDEAITLIHTWRPLRWQSQPDRRLPAITDPIWSKLYKLFSRDYFRRMWIIQEVALARECILLCGKSQLTWEDVSSTGWYWLERGQSIVGGRDAIQVAAATVATRNDIRDPKQPQNPGKILSLLLTHRMAEATDPRDQIFALRGLLVDAFDGLGFEVDYSVDVDSLYRDFALRMTEKMQCLDLFTTPRVAQTGSSSLSSLPSWVSDWTQTTPLNSLLDYERKTGGIRFKSTSGSRHTLSVDSDGTLFGIEGYFVDSIIDTVYVSPLSASIGPEHTPLETLRAMHHYATIASQQWRAIEEVAGVRGFGKSARLSSKIDVLCRTLCGGDCGTQWEAIRRAYNKTRKRIWFLHQVLKLDRLLPFYITLSILIMTIFIVTPPFRSGGRRIGEPNDKVDAFANHNKSHGRHVFRTRDGRIGLGPPLTTFGDIIMLCKGSRLPLVLRRSGQHWQLIGDCYIDCMVNGELWDESKCGRFWLS